MHAISVQKSLEQVIAAAKGELNFDYNFDGAAIDAKPDTFNVCKHNYMPEREVDPAILGPCAEILVTTPVPGLATGLGELPRFSAEFGTFIGVVSAVRGNGIMGDLVLIKTLRVHPVALM